MKPTRPIALLILFECLAALVPLNAGDLSLWYLEPAEKWTEALPVGSGRMGAMVFGGTASERIQFNEDTLWKGKPHDYVREGAGTHLAEIRRLVFAGKADEAGKLAKEKTISDPVRQMPYQPFGDLRLDFPGHEKVTDYRRDLDLDSAVATVRYKVGEVTFTREVFASYPDRAVVLRLTADQPGKITFKLRMDSPHEVSQTRAGTALLKMTGKVRADGLDFESRAQVRTEGGSVRTDKNALQIEKSDSVTVILVAATSFKNFEDISAEPGKRCEEDLSRLANRTYQELRGTHVADHQKLFRRVSLDLGRTPAAELPTDARQRALKTASLGNDPALATLHFQYGRYLLIASSRPGTQPANLQGVWNEELNPPWESKYTLNINARDELLARGVVQSERDARTALRPDR